MTRVATSPPVAFATVLVSALGVMSLIGTAPVNAQRATTLDVLTRATAYVARFIRQFKNVVAEERYVQQIVTFNGRKVDSKADFLLVQLGPQGQYIPFRDVFEVNGAKVRAGESRLVELLSHPSDDLVTQARAINAESTKYNIGVQRTINNPLIGIVLLQEVLHPQFTFSLGDGEKVDG